MKRSLYEMLGVARDADQAQIDTAFAAAGEKLNVVTVRGTAAAIVESQLLHDGYLLLSNPAKRAAYDAKLLAEEGAGHLVMMPAGMPPRRMLSGEILVLIALAAVLGGIAYHHVSIKMDEVRVAHEQAVKRKADENAKAIIIDATQEKPVVIMPGNAAQKR